MLNRRSFLNFSLPVATFGLTACSGGTSSPSNSSTIPPTLTERATGWTQMPVEIYNGIPQIGGNFRYDSSFLTFDLSDPAFMANIGMPKTLPEPLNQGNQPSCTAWAVGYAAATQTLLASGISISSPISPADLFTKIRNRLAPNACSQGAYISYAMDVLVQEGVASLSSVPYSDQQCGILVSAPTYNIDGFSRVFAGDVAAIRGALQSMQPVSFGIQVDSRFQGLSSNNNVYIPSGGGGGHAMSVIGYDDRRQMFKVINSWGGNWGSGGYFWISYSDFAKFAQDVCIPFVRRPSNNQLLATTASNSNSSIRGQHFSARPYGAGVPGSYGVGVEIGWSGLLAVTAASISVLDSAQNSLFTRNFTVSQIARGLRFGGLIPDGSANYVYVYSTVTGRDSAGQVTTLTALARPNTR